jgi:hypothetical protein
MLSRESIESFILKEGKFFAATQDQRDLDPLHVSQDDLLLPFRQKLIPQDTGDFEQKLAGWLTQNPEAELTSVRAARRDFDKVLGHLAATDRATADDKLEALLVEICNRTGETPRASIYDYAIGGSPLLANTYTGEGREINIISIFESSLSAAHLAIWSILRARLAIAENDMSVNVEQALTQALEYAKEMHYPMIRAYRDVGPDFVANELTRYTCAIHTPQGQFEGPNPSHSGFVVLDRFVYGSFRPLYARQPSLKTIYDYRLSDMPLHLRELMTRADTANDDQPLMDLSAPVSSAARTLAIQLGDTVRKFKTIHRSYADKALAAKGKQLSEDEPDFLSEIIAYARSIGDNTPV